MDLFFLQDCLLITIFSWRTAYEFFFSITSRPPLMVFPLGATKNNVISHRGVVKIYGWGEGCLNYGGQRFSCTEMVGGQNFSAQLQRGADKIFVERKLALPIRFTDENQFIFCLSSLGGRGQNFGAHGKRGRGCDFRKRGNPAPPINHDHSLTRPTHTQNPRFKKNSETCLVKQPWEQFQPHFPTGNCESG